MARGTFVGLGDVDLGQDNVGGIGNFGAWPGPGRVWFDAGGPM